ncbi:hypothetical protein [Streptomyces sp. CRN 30]|uniref:hypothetical protein n=1 Tax=Streptomyces sp. CRN 30 TaxID=3075613 RepID=UPI002A840B82|nr:hypothetical protein [Streptomyces sp. CRN 30]
MSGSRPRRTALSRTRSPWGRALLVVLVVAATFALFCVGTPAARAAGAPTPSPVSAPTAAPGPQQPLDAVGPPRHADRQPCEEDPGGHHCHGRDHHGVPAQAPHLGADRSPALGQPSTGPAGRPAGPSREPGAARPPDLHELQLLRV